MMKIFQQMKLLKTGLATAEDWNLISATMPWNYLKGERKLRK